MFKYISENKNDRGCLSVVFCFYRRHLDMGLTAICKWAWGFHFHYHGTRARSQTRTAERCGKTKPTRLSGLRWSTVACKLHVPDRDQLRRVGWWLLNQPERRENQRVAVPPKSQRPPASLSETRARNAGDTSGA